MKIWDITLDCDDKLLFKAETIEEAWRLAGIEAAGHDALVEDVVEVDLSSPGLLAWIEGFE